MLKKAYGFCYVIKEKASFLLTHNIKILKLVMSFSGDDMERYQIINLALTPVDRMLGIGLDLAIRFGLYENVKNFTHIILHKILLHNFVENHFLRVFGEENIPEYGGCIIAANHQSWLDAQVLGVSSRRRLFFIAKSEFKDWPVLRRIMDLTDTIYVKRKGGGEGLDVAERAILDGKAVVIFPEGTIPGEEDIPRWEVERDTGLLRGHTGVVRLALATGCPIIPCGISGTGKAFPPECYPRLEILPIPKPEPITVKFGKPIIFQMQEKEPTKDDLKKMTKEVMKAISSLVEHERNFVPIQVPLTIKENPSTLPMMAYKRDNEKGVKSNIGVLVLHGFTSHIHCVDPLVKYLDDLGVPYRFPILRGHGTKFEDMEGTKAEDWYEDAENSLLDLLEQSEKVIVVGLSMGGLLALDLAAHYNDKVAGVVTIAAALFFKDPLAPLAPLLAKFIRYWPSPNAYNDKKLKEIENKNYPKFATSAFLSLYKYTKKIKNILSFVRAPILILHSRKDNIITPRSAEIIYRKVSSKDKKIVWFEKSGHEMLLDLERDEVIKVIVDFMKKIIGR